MVEVELRDGRQKGEGDSKMKVYKGTDKPDTWYTLKDGEIVEVVTDDEN